MWTSSLIFIENKNNALVYSLNLSVFNPLQLIYNYENIEKELKMKLMHLTTKFYFFKKMKERRKEWK